MTEFDLVASLQTAIARADATWISQPSHLRRRLEEELGAGARAHRAQIHQLVVAAEERIPIRLKRNGWSPAERDELGHLLVVTRGWTAEASDWAVTTWAAALGLTDERPAVQAAVRPVATPARPLPPPVAHPAPIPPSGALPGATDLPSRQFAAATDLPSSMFVGATELPSNPPPPAPANSPASGIPHPSSPPAGTTRRLPTAMTRGTTRKASTYLNQELDVAYEVKASHSPAWLLLAGIARADGRLVDAVVWLEQARREYPRQPEDLAGHPLPADEVTSAGDVRYRQLHALGWWRALKGNQLTVKDQPGK